MIYDILEAKLAAVDFIPGETLFREYMPGDCSIGVLTKVPLQGLPIDPYIPNYYKGRMQVIVRHKDPEAGVVMTRRVQAALSLKTAREIHPETETRGEVHLDKFQPETLPIAFPRLDGNGYEWSQHYSCAFGMKENPVLA